MIKSREILIRNSFKFKKKLTMFSKSCEYAIKASIFIALNSTKENKVGYLEVSTAIDSPKAFTAKILQKLTKEGLIQSVRGVNGGFFISKENISKIKLSQIVRCIDGDVVFKSCGLGLPLCNENHPCPLHEVFMTIRNDLQTMLEETNLEKLISGISTGKTFLKDSLKL